MQSLLYEGPWRVAIADCPEPDEPTGREALVRIRATGICGTDLGIVTGVYFARIPVILGHESTGEVVAVGEAVESLQVGARVVIDPTYSCGFCAMCRTDRPNHCERKTQTETGVSRDGTFAPYYKTEERFLYPLADEVSFEAGTLVEPLSCALTGVDRLRTRSDLRTLVLGAGPLGVLYAFALATQGLGGALVEIASERRALAAAVTGAGWRGCASLEEAVDSVSSNGEVDLIVDTTGVLGQRSLPLLARGGQLLTIGLRSASCAVDMLRVADRSLSIIGSIDSLGTFNAAKELIERGFVPAERIVSHRWELADYRQAFLHLGCDLDSRIYNGNASALKAVLRPA